MTKLELPPEELLATILLDEGITIERQFKIPGSNFIWDIHIKWTNILIEVQGGIWMAKGAHNTGKAIIRDATKNNYALFSGYRVLYATPEMIHDNSILKTIKYLLNKD